LQHYNHIANQNRAANEAAYKEWLTSHTPAEIEKANQARRLLWRRSGKTSQKLKLIKDDRLPKRPGSSFMLFAQERQRSGDLKHISLGETGKLLGQEWKELSDGDKQVRLLHSHAESRC
jgi:hypothetical protein